MIVTEALKKSQAFVAAWLPGTQGGEALTNAIFGKYLFRSDPENPRVNSLPVAWIRSMDQLQNYPIYESSELPTIKDPLFEIGFGLSTVKKSVE